MPAPSESIERQVGDNLLAIISAYRKKTKKSLSTCSRKFYGKSTFFDNLKKRRGPSISLETLDNVLNKIRAAWPDGADWPMVPVIYMSRRPSDN